MSRASAEDIHALLEEWIEALPPLVYWHRKQVNKDTEAILNRELSVETGPSFKPGLEGVFTKHKVQGDERLLDYRGYLMKYREFRSMSIAVYTAVEIPNDIMHTMNPLETISDDVNDRYLLVADPRSMAARLVSVRGPDDQGASNANCNLNLGAKGRAHAGYYKFPEKRGNEIEKGVLYTTFASIFTKSKGIAANRECTIDYGKHFWMDCTPFCSGCYYKEDDPTQLLMCSMCSQRWHHCCALTAPAPSYHHFLCTNCFHSAQTLGVPQGLHLPDHLRYPTKTTLEQEHRYSTLQSLKVKLGTSSETLRLCLLYNRYVNDPEIICAFGGLLCGRSECVSAGHAVAIPGSSLNRCGSFLALSLHHHVANQLPTSSALDLSAIAKDQTPVSIMIMNAGVGFLAQRSCSRCANAKLDFVKVEGDADAPSVPVLLSLGTNSPGEGVLYCYQTEDESTEELDCSYCVRSSEERSSEDDEQPEEVYSNEELVIESDSDETYGGI